MSASLFVHLQALPYPYSFFIARPGKKKLPLPLWAFIVIGVVGLLLVAAVVGVIIFFVMRRRGHSHSEEYSHLSQQCMEEGALLVYCLGLIDAWEQ